MSGEGGSGDSGDDRFGSGGDKGVSSGAGDANGRTGLFGKGSDTPAAPAAGQPLNINPMGDFNPAPAGTTFEPGATGFGGGSSAPPGQPDLGYIPTSSDGGLAPGTPPMTNDDIINSIMQGITSPLPNSSGVGTSNFDMGSPFQDPAFNAALSNYTGSLSAPGTTSIGADTSGVGGTPSSNIALPLATGAAQGGGTSAVSTAAPAGTGAGKKDLTSGGGGGTGGMFSGINPLGALLNAGALAYNINQGNQIRPTTDALMAKSNELKGMTPDMMAKADALREEGAAMRDKAGNIIDKGSAYADYLATGTLPPSIQSQVDNALAAKKASIISNYAAQGMPTDPNKNSSLRSELATLNDQKSELSGKLALQLLSGGTNLIGSGTGLAGAGTGVTSAGTGLTQAAIQTTGLDADILKTLSNIDQTQSARMGQAIANFAAALSGNKGNSINLKLT